jgi:Recombinase
MRLRSAIQTRGKGYVARGMSLGDLQAKLNADLERFPPPESPDPRRRIGRWGRSSVWEILRNPKYTGYQVWNRRARKRGGKTNPPEQWICSEEPAHDALVSREMFEEAARRSVSRDNVTKAAAARADYAPRTYLLRVLPPVRGLRSEDARARTPRRVLLRLRDRASPGHTRRRRASEDDRANRPRHSA